MKGTLAVLSLTLAVLAPAFAADDVKTIAQQADEKWINAYNTNDGAALTNLYTADAVLLPQGVPQPIIGAANIRHFVDAMLQQKLGNLMLPVVEARMLDPNTLYQAGTWSADVGNQHIAGTYLSILVRDGGEWKYRADTWNLMPPPSAAPGAASAASSK